MGVQRQLKLFHWQTKNYGHHMALGEAHDSLTVEIDSFFECAAGQTRVPDAMAAQIKGERLEDFVSDTQVRRFVKQSLERAQEYGMDGAAKILQKLAYLLRMH
jgi:hypothetical protein